MLQKKASIDFGFSIGITMIPFTARAVNLRLSPPSVPSVFRRLLKLPVFNAEKSIYYRI
jgi:hypothetical protein